MNHGLLLVENNQDRRRSGRHSVDDFTGAGPSSIMSVIDDGGGSGR